MPGKAISMRSDPPGPGTPAQDAPVFEAPWQAQAFVMVVALHRQGMFTWQEWAAQLGAARARPDAAPDGSDYYEDWLAALERLLIDKGIAAQADMARLSTAWRRAARATPHGQPITLDNDPAARAGTDAGGA